jgi:hypothetical protein
MQLELGVDGIFDRNMESAAFKFGAAWPVAFRRRRRHPHCRLRGGTAKRTGPTRAGARPRRVYEAQSTLLAPDLGPIGRPMAHPHVSA